MTIYMRSTLLEAKKTPVIHIELFHLLTQTYTSYEEKYFFESAKGLSLKL